MCVGGVRRGGQSDVVRQIFSSIVTRFHHDSYFLIPYLIPMGETCIFFYSFFLSFFFDLSSQNKSDNV